MYQSIHELAECKAMLLRCRSLKGAERDEMKELTGDRIHLVIKVPYLVAVRVVGRAR